MMIYIVDLEGYLHLVECDPDDLVEKVLETYFQESSLSGGYLVEPTGQKMQRGQKLKSYNVKQRDVLEYRT